MDKEEINELQRQIDELKAKTDQMQTNIEYERMIIEQDLRMKALFAQINMMNRYGLL